MLKVSIMLRTCVWCIIFYSMLLAQGTRYNGPTDGAGDPAALREGVMDANRVILQFQNNTQLAMHPAVPGYSSWWPKGAIRGSACFTTAIYLPLHGFLLIKKPICLWIYPAISNI